MPTTAPTLDPRRILWDAYQAALADVATHEEVVALLRADLEHGEEALAAAHQLAYQILELLPATATGPPPAAPRHRKVKNTTRPPAPKPAPAPPSAGRPGPKTGKPPLDEIAEVVNAAIRANQPVVEALATRYGKPASTVKNWFAQVRKAGLAVGPSRPIPAPAAPAPKPTPADDETEHPLADVAATVREAYEVGRRPIQTVIDRFDVDRATAQQLVNAAREAGLLPPRSEPQVPGELPPERAVPRTGTSL